MDVPRRILQLKKIFSLEKKTELDENKLEIIPCHFIQTTEKNKIEEFQRNMSTTDFCPVTDDCIDENKNFNYTVFTPKGKEKNDQAIILLHGLNERKWDKYLTWAEYMAEKTGKSVILFPIAFHINRAPAAWSNPRLMMPWVNIRKKLSTKSSNTTFFNAAISYRMSSQPQRFYYSGLETVYNIEQLVAEMKEGRHPLFKENTSVSIFAYSIGAFISQILLISNPNELFTDTKLFMFCGGSLLSHVNADSRDIMDSEAFKSMRDYYVKDFSENKLVSTDFLQNDELDKAFRMMIKADKMKDQRDTFFERTSKSIRSITLKVDSVIPTLGVEKALGNAAPIIHTELDFPFPYTHQEPFPTNNHIAKELVNESFTNVFNRACAFL